MSLRSGLSVVIVSTVFVSQIILQTEAQSGVVKEARQMTFYCAPEQLHGADKLRCLALRLEEGRRLFEECLRHAQPPV